MDDDKSVEDLLAIHDRHRDRLEKRLGYEWKMSFSLWAALGAIGVTMLTGKHASAPCWVLAIVYGSVFVLVIVYIYVWLRDIANRNISDRNKAKLYLDEVTEREDKSLSDSRRALRKKYEKDAKKICECWLCDSGVITQIVITICLAAIILVAVTALHGDGAKQSLSVEVAGGTVDVTMQITRGKVDVTLAPAGVSGGTSAGIQERATAQPDRKTREATSKADSDVPTTKPASQNVSH